MNIKNFKLNPIPRKKGFTLLLSLLVVSVVLSVGLGVSDIMNKELKLSSVGRESQIAFYAADAGVECFFYWEIKHPELADTAFGNYESGSNPTINCAGKNITIPALSNGPYEFSLDLGNNSCAGVKVTKSGLVTTVESRGYNTACDSDSPFKVERAIQFISTRQISGTISPPAKLINPEDFEDDNFSPWTTWRNPFGKNPIIQEGIGVGGSKGLFLDSALVLSPEPALCNSGIDDGIDYNFYFPTSGTVSFWAKSDGGGCNTPVAWVYNQTEEIWKQEGIFDWQRVSVTFVDATKIRIGSTNSKVYLDNIAIEIEVE